MNHFAVHQKLTQHCKSTLLQFKKKNPRGRGGSLLAPPHLLMLCNGPLHRPPSCSSICVSLHTVAGQPLSRCRLLLPHAHLCLPWAPAWMRMSEEEKTIGLWNENRSWVCLSSCSTTYRP